MFHNELIGAIIMTLHLVRTIRTSLDNKKFGILCALCVMFLVANINAGSVSISGGHLTVYGEGTRPWKFGTELCGTLLTTTP